MKLKHITGEEEKNLTPSQIDRPVYLLNFPQGLRTDNPNNSLMKKMTPEQRKVDHDKANSQFLELNKFILEIGGVVYLVPTDFNYQDQVYVSNLGIYLPHIKDKNVIIAANFKTPPRRGEEDIGIKFFELMGYEVHRPSSFWEGQAELRYIRDNIYVGGYGQRSVQSAYDWMKRKFNMIIPTVETRYPDMYHLDCSMLRLTPEKILCPMKAFSPEEISELEKYVEILDVPFEIATTGSFNGVRAGNFMMYGDPATYIEPGQTKQDKILIDKIFKFHDIVSKASGLEPKFFDLTEFEKSGADLGCMVMYLNYYGQ